MYRTNFGMTTNIGQSLEQTIELIGEALVDQGLIVLNKSYLPNPKGVRSDWQGKRMALLTACYPNITAEAITLRRDSASLLFCRIGIYETGETSCAVSVIDPKKAVARYTRDDGLIRLAARTKDRLIIAFLLLERNTLLKTC